MISSSPDVPSVIIDPSPDNIPVGSNDHIGEGGRLEIDSSERPRARSLDFGKLFSFPTQRSATPDLHVLLHSDEENEGQSKEKIKKKLFHKFNRFLRRGSESLSQKSDRSRQGTVDFGHAFPNSLFSVTSAMTEQNFDELLRETKGRRGSLYSQPAGTTKYVVEAEDTLASIAARYKFTVAELKSLNRLMSTLLFPGQVLYVPDQNYQSTGGKRPSEPCPTPMSLGIPGTFHSHSRPATPTKLDKVIEEIAHHDEKPKKASILSAEVNYMTGGEVNIPGLLTISASEVRFDPYQSEKNDYNNVSDEIQIIDLVKSKMATARMLHSANFKYGNPFGKKAKGSWDSFNFPKDDIGNKIKVAENQFNYLRLTLVRKAKFERPFIEALVKMCIPGPTYVEHFFMLQPEVLQGLQAFLKSYYPDKLIAEAVHPTTLTATDINANIDLGNSTLHWIMSVAELFNLALPTMSDASQIFNDGHVRVLREFLPPKVDGRPWHLVYSTWKHGFSLNTMYRLAEKFKKDCVALIIIKDTNSQVFGGLLCGGIIRSDSFYGTGESFLFTYSPLFQQYPWTGKNNCFAKGGADCFVMGSSEEAFGLWIDEELNRGCSNKCETFDNETLTKNSYFQIQALEVWTFPQDIY